MLFNRCSSALVVPQALLLLSPCVKGVTSQALLVNLPSHFSYSCSAVLCLCSSVFVPRSLLLSACSSVLAPQPYLLGPASDYSLLGPCSSSVLAPQHLLLDPCSSSSAAEPCSSALAPSLLTLVLLGPVSPVVAPQTLLLRSSPFCFSVLSPQSWLLRPCSSAIATRSLLLGQDTSVLAPR